MIRYIVYDLAPYCQLKNKPAYIFDKIGVLNTFFSSDMPLDLFSKIIIQFIFLHQMH